MKIGTVSISYSRKFNLGNYESIELGCSLWAQVEDEEDAEGVVQFLYHQAKAAVKSAAMPVIKANEFQINKARSQHKVMADSEEVITEDL
jgi:predicted naringenin-chalcone synthase